MISAALVADAREQKIEPCKQIRVDSTITDSNIHHPTAKKCCISLGKNHLPDSEENY